MGSEAWIKVNHKLNGISALIGLRINTFVAGYNSGNVKHKADISLDEWLHQGTLYAEVNRGGATTAGDQGVAESSHGHDGASLREGIAASPSPLAEPVETSAADWFWELLSQASYEVW